MIILDAVLVAQEKYVFSFRPFLYREAYFCKRNNPYNNIGSASIADNVSNTFQPRYLSQRTHLEVPQYCTSPTYRSADTIDDQTYGTSLSQEKILKVGEFKRLINKYSLYCTNPDRILELAIFNSINGDDTLLDNKLEQLRTIDTVDWLTGSVEGTDVL